MRIRFLTSRSGPFFTAAPGDELDIDDKEAVRLIRAGKAEAVRAAAPVETATPKKTTEKAVRRGRNAKRSK